MKHSILTSFVALMFGLFCFACKHNLCETVSCKNGGSCEDGKCVCPTGYTGVKCEIKINPCFAMGCDTTNSTCIVTASGASCVCYDGWEGTLCNVPWVQKFFGNYQVTGFSCVGGYEMQLIQGTKFNSVTLVNFHNMAGPTTTSKIVADLVSPYAFNIPDQPMPYDVTPDGTYAVIVSGSGEMAADKKNIELYYQLYYTRTNDTVKCHYTTLEKF